MVTAVCWRVTGSRIPTRTDRACISLTSSRATSSTNFILRSISVNNATVSPGLLAGRATMPEHSAMTMPCRAASPGSNGCSNLCQALKPSSSLKIFLSDPPQQPSKVGVLLHHVAVLRLARVSRDRQWRPPLGRSRPVPSSFPGSLCPRNRQLPAPPLVRLVCEVPWDHVLLEQVALVVVCSGRNAFFVYNSLLKVGLRGRSLDMQPMNCLSKSFKLFSCSFDDFVQYRLVVGKFSVSSLHFCVSTLNWLTAPESLSLMAASRPSSSSILFSMAPLPRNTDNDFWHDKTTLEPTRTRWKND